MIFPAARHVSAAQHNQDHARKAATRSPVPTTACVTTLVGNNPTRQVLVRPSTRPPRPAAWPQQRRHLTHQPVRVPPCQPATYVHRLPGNSTQHRCPTPHHAGRATRASGSYPDRSRARLSPPPPLVATPAPCRCSCPAASPQPPSSAPQRSTLATLTNLPPCVPRGAMMDPPPPPASPSPPSDLSAPGPLPLRVGAGTAPACRSRRRARRCP